MSFLFVSCCFCCCCCCCCCYFGHWGIVTNYSRCAEHAALIAESETNLQAILDKALEMSQDKGLDSNSEYIPNKTPYMPSSKQERQNQTSRHYQIFRPATLSSSIENVHIKMKITRAKDTFCHIKEVTQNKNISVPHRIRIIIVCVWSIPLCRCHSWTVDRQTEKESIGELKVVLERCRSLSKSLTTLSSHLQCHVPFSPDRKERKVERPSNLEKRLILCSIVESFE